MKCWIRPGRWQELVRFTYTDDSKRRFDATMEEFKEEICYETTPGKTPDYNTVKARIYTARNKYALAEVYAEGERLKQDEGDRDTALTMEELREEYLKLPPNTRGSVVDDEILELVASDFLGIAAIPLWQAREVLAIRLHDTKEKDELFLPLPLSLGGIKDETDLGAAWFGRRFGGLVTGSDVKSPDPNFLLFLEGRFREEPQKLKKYFQSSKGRDCAFKPNMATHSATELIKFLLRNCPVDDSDNGPKYKPVKKKPVPRALVTNKARTKRQRHKVHTDKEETKKVQVGYNSGKRDGGESSSSGCEVEAAAVQSGRHPLDQPGIRMFNDHAEGRAQRLKAVKQSEETTGRT
jgi:hypothetical protein